MASTLASIVTQPGSEATHRGLSSLASVFHVKIDHGTVWIDIPYFYEPSIELADGDPMTQTAFSFDQLEYPTFQDTDGKTLPLRSTLSYPAYLGPKPVWPSDYLSFEPHSDGRLDLCHVEPKKWKTLARRLRERQGYAEYLEWTKSARVRWDPNGSEWQSLIENFPCYVHDHLMFGLGTRVVGTCVLAQILFLVTDQPLTQTQFDIVEGTARHLGASLLRWWSTGSLYGFRPPRCKTTPVTPNGNPDVCAVLNFDPTKCILLTP